MPSFILGFIYHIRDKLARFPKKRNWQISVEDYSTVMKMNKIREILKTRGLTQGDLERMTGIDQSTLSKVINERKTITLCTAKRISSALGYSIEYIWPD